MALCGALEVLCTMACHAQVSLREAMLRPTAAAAVAQEAGRVETAVPQTIEAALQGMAARAAVIFTGSVLRVTGQTGGTALVELVVEDGLRGVATGTTYRMRVSSWGGGVERYHAGQRALFLLHAPSVSGFSSPVDGERGIVPLSGDALVGTVDLRWVATTVQRTVAVQTEADAPADAAVWASAAAPVPFLAVSSAAPANALQQVPVAGVDAAMQMRSSNVTGQDVHAIDRDLVTGMLHTWTAAATRVAATAGQAR